MVDGILEKGEALFSSTTEKVSDSEANLTAGPPEEEEEDKSLAGKVRFKIYF